MHGEILELRPITMDKVRINIDKKSGGLLYYIDGKDEIINNQKLNLKESNPEGTSSKNKNSNLKDSKNKQILKSKLALECEL